MISFIRRGPETEWQEWRTVVRKGKPYKNPSGGDPIELFPISVMAEAVERTPKAIVLWEKQGLFPLPTYKLASGGKVSTHRAYSGVQIVAANNLLRLFEVPLNGGGRAGQKAGTTIFEFLREYSELFAIPGIEVDPATEEAFVLDAVELRQGIRGTVRRVIKKFKKGSVL